MLLHAVVAEDEGSREKVRARLAATGEPVACVQDWSAIRNGSQAFDSLVAVSPSEGNRTRWLQGLASVRVTHRWVPMVLVVPDPRAVLIWEDAARYVDAVVGMRDLTDELPFAVDRAGVQRFLRRAEHQLERHFAVPAALRHAMVLALRSEPPFRTVNALAAVLGRDRSGLQRMWKGHRSALGFRDDVGLKDLLAAILVTRAVGVHREARGWDGAAGRVGVHVGTVRRRVRAWSGVSLGELSRLTTPQICDKLWEGISADGRMDATVQDVEQTTKCGRPRREG